MRIGQARVATANRLAAAGVQEAGIEAEALVRHVLGTDRAGYFASIGTSLEPDNKALLNGLVARRASGEPLAYVLGHREFYGLEFMVNPSVLVPRQETELLVDAVLDHADSRAPASLTIADVGTGCGAIAVVLASRVPDVTVYATDLSAEALAVARVNSDSHGVSSGVKLVQGDLLGALPSVVDVIVSNPPYLRTGLLPTLARELRWEPACALDGGADGLAVIRRLLAQASDRLSSDGALFVEIDPPLTEPVMGMARSLFPLATVFILPDLLGLPRVVGVRQPAGV